jgi:hypothetical protein
MKRLSRLVEFAIAAVLVLGLSVPALATEGGSESEEETTETTVAPQPIFENGEPAIVVPPVEEEPEEQPWTSRYLYPAIVIMTVLLLVFLVIWYNRNIRHKYDVVAE